MTARQAPRGQKWVRIAKAAHASGISARTLRRWALEGRIPSRQPGGGRSWHLLYLPAVLAARATP